MTRVNVVTSDDFIYYRTALGRLGAKNNFLVERYKVALKRDEQYEDDDLASRIRCECYREFLKFLQSPADEFLMQAEFF